MSNDNLVMIICAAVALLIIIISIILIKKSKKDDEESASILDIDAVGVPDSKDFSYGYEKEETIIMQPVEEPKKEEETKEE